jgi:hypothetical protein
MNVISFANFQNTPINFKVTNTKHINYYVEHKYRAKKYSNKTVF